jgi:hypothetical protein
MQQDRFCNDPRHHDVDNFHCSDEVKQQLRCIKDNMNILLNKHYDLEEQNKHLNGSRIDLYKQYIKFIEENSSKMNEIKLKLCYAQAEVEFHRYILIALGACTISLLTKVYSPVFFNIWEKLWNR